MLLTLFIKKTFVFILLTFCFFLLPADAFDARFEHLSREQGLSHATVYDILQDSYGYIWVATADGLNYYDGYKFNVFRYASDDEYSLSNNRVMTIYEDSQYNLWVGTSGGGLNRFDRFHNRFERFDFEQMNPTSLSSDHVRVIFEDDRQNLWIGTRNGLNLLDIQKKQFKRYVSDKNLEHSLSHDNVSAIAQHPDGKLWVATLEGGLNLFDPVTEQFRHYRYQANDVTSLSNDRVYALHYDRSQQLWIGTMDQGLNRYDQQKDSFVRYPFNDGTAMKAHHLSHPRVQSITDDYLGRIWIGTYGGGVNQLDPDTGLFTHYRFNGLENNSISSDRINEVYADLNGEIWIGTSGGGVNKHNIRSERFGHVLNKLKREQSANPNDISAIMMQKNGDLWVGTHSSGVDRYTSTHSELIHYRYASEQGNGLSDDSISGIIEDQQGNIFIGTDGGGLNYFDLNSGRFFHYRHDPQVTDSISSDRISVLMRDHDGQIWIGSVDGGLNLFDPSTKTFIHFRHDEHSDNSLSSNHISSLYQDSDGIIWIGTNGGGLNRFDVKTHQFSQYNYDPNHKQSLSHDVVLSIVEDQNYRIWVGTRGGLNRFYRHSGQFERFGINEGLVNDVVHGILIDEENHLWLSTNQGLSQFNPLDKSFRHYRAKDGLQSDEFNDHAYFKSHTGELFFGGINGFNRFYPQHIDEDSRSPTVVLTELRLFNKLVHIQNANADPELFTLPRPIDHLDELILSHEQSLISFEFAALHFTEPQSNQYAYKLEGWDQDWIMTDAKNRRATYTNIPPGDYLLRVKASNHYGYWNHQGKSLPITILPSKWETWWAYALYYLVAMLCIYMLIRFQRRRLRSMRRLNYQLQRVDKLKDEFLANTSHELRTPLNGIIGLAESLMDGVTGELPSRTNANLAMIVASGKRLSNLVNDILDFSKLKNSNLTIYPRPVDLHTMTDVVLALSKPLLGGKNVDNKTLDLINAVPKNLPAVMADEDRLQQILHNLIDNAIKFTENGHVTVSATRLGQMLRVNVIDTGIGIAETALSTIFESFEQVQGAGNYYHGGTGLGLTISRQLVELHGGRLTVESQVNTGTTFSFTLPTANDLPAVNLYAERSVARLHYLQEQSHPTSELRNAEQEQDEWLDYLSQDYDLVHQIQHSVVEVDSTDKALGKQVINTQHPHDCSKFRILLVDDEPVNRQVLNNHLSMRNYRLVEACDGQQALQLVEHEGPFDLILLDIMMPSISGYEVCKSLRKKFAVNDLPIIFLTAKNQVADLVQSFAAGANDFLTKPVSKYELLKRVEIHLRLLDINRHLEQKITERTTELVHAEKMASLGTLTAGVAHEINNPTNFAHISVKNLNKNLESFKLMLLDLVTDEADNALIKKFNYYFTSFTDDVSTIAEGTKRIRDIVNDLQSFTQADAELKTTVMVTDCLNSAINLVRTQHKNIDFNTSFEHYPELLGYPSQLNQLFMNLIVNACDAIKTKVSKMDAYLLGEVRITCKLEPSWVVIVIADNGIGMDCETKSRLFEPFFTTKEIGDGTGLGLSIAYGVVQKHHGELVVESQYGDGSEFILYLPREEVSF